MVRFLGVDVPDRKRLEISLTYIYGIGRALAKVICDRLGLDPNKKTQDLTEEETVLLAGLLQSKEYLLEGDLRRKHQNDIKRLVSIHCYRGIRHRVGLPVRGQRTRSNARTRKGRKKTVANKKK